MKLGIAIFMIWIYSGLVMHYYLEPKAYKQGYEAGCQSVLDELHAKTDSLILETDSLLFPDNPAYEYAVEEMLRRKAK